MNFIDQNLLDYCESYSSDEPEYLKEIHRQTYLTQINPRMLSGHLQGRFLKLIIQLCQPKRILEIGTYTGYSALCMAEGLSGDSFIDTIEVNEELEPIILKNFEKANAKPTIHLHIGNASEIILNNLKSERYDLVFIDADKQNYPVYFDLIKNLLNPGALLIADNVLWSGKVIEQNELNTDQETMAIHLFNKTIAADNSFETVMLPIRDGITIARKK